MKPLHKAIVTGALISTLSTSLEQPAAAAFDKTRFVADLGIAYFCFHHWVAKPYENHEFDNSAPHHKKALLKAGLALLWAVHEVKHASKIAHTSKDPSLVKLSSELDKLTGSFSTFGKKMKKGTFADSDYKSLGDSFSSVSGSVGTAGYDVKDKETKIPGVTEEK